MGKATLTVHILTNAMLRQAVRPAKARAPAWVTLGAFLAVTLLVPGTSLAQLPDIPDLPGGDSPVIKVQLEAKDDLGRKSTVIRQSAGSAHFNFTISFQCLSGTTSGGEPEYGVCSGQFGDQEVLVTLQETNRPYPDGWQVQIGAKEHRMMAKETRTVGVGVQLLRDEPERDRFSIGLAATAQPIVQPPLNTLVDNLDQQSQDSDRVNIDKQITFAETLSAYIREFQWPLLAGAAVLILAGVILVDRKRRRPSLEFSSAQPTQSVEPGKSASFPVRLKNAGRHGDRIRVLVLDEPQDWNTILPLHELDLRPGEDTQFWVTVRAPANAQAGQVVAIRLEARSTQNGGGESTLNLQVTVSGEDTGESPFGSHPGTSDPIARQLALEQQISATREATGVDIDIDDLPEPESLAEDSLEADLAALDGEPEPRPAARRRKRPSKNKAKSPKKKAAKKT